MFPLWVFVTIAKYAKKKLSRGNSLQFTFDNIMIYIQFCIKGSINLKESLIGNSIIQDWKEHCHCLCTVALHLFQRGDWMEGSEEYRAMQLPNSQEKCCTISFQMRWCQEWWGCFCIRGREQETMRWLTFNSLMEKGHLQCAKCYPGNSSTRTFEKLQETFIFTSLLASVKSPVHALCGTGF